MTTLRRGSSGPEVSAWQTRLLALGHAVTVDGDYGPLTEEATRAFQRSRGLTPVDGIAGPQTLTAAGLVDATTATVTVPLPLGPDTPRERPPTGRATVARVKGIERLTPAQLGELDAAAQAIGVPVDWLAAVISFETAGTFSPSVLNAAGSRAVGLIQFMPKTAQALLRTSTEEEATRRAAAMSFGEQLRSMVVPYFAPYRGRLRSLDDLYLAVFYPAFISKAPADVVARREGPNAAVYRQNAGFDRDGRGYITKSDITSTIRGVLSAASGFVSFEGVATASRTALPLLLALGGGAALLWMSQRGRAA